MNETLEVRSFWRDFDWALFGAALLLALIGLTEIYSATMNIPGDVSFVKQAIFVLAGLALVFLISSIDYHTISEHIPWLYLGSLAVLIYTPLAARRIAGARSWIDLGPVSVQPSEIVKMVVVVAMARYLSDLHVKGYLSFNQILKAAIICGIPMGLILLQPDMGTALTYTPILGVGLLLRGLKPKIILTAVFIALMVVPMSAYLLKDFLKEHQKDRILTFIDPSRDPKGKGYQVYQSKIAIGSGGLLGKGLFKGSQNQLGFLPERHTDFIFSVVGEELGFVGVLGTLGLLGFILFRSLHNAQTARDSLGVFIILGVVGVYFFHMAVNVAMQIGFFPVVGIPLPFLSYGGSSILTAFIGLGLVISVHRRRYVN
jgi:rod shape determining protein RodA